MLGLKPLIAEVVGNVTWSVFVCVGLAVGTAVARARMPLMGFLGLFSAPLAFEASRVLHKGTLEALAVTGGGGQDLSPLLVAAIKGIEYGYLGLLIGWVSQRSWGGARGRGATRRPRLRRRGVALAAGATPPPATSELFVESINEILFPVGCALVLFSAEILGRRRRTAAVRRERGTSSTDTCEPTTQIPRGPESALREGGLLR